MPSIGATWGYWWETEITPPFVPPFLSRFRWGNDPDNPTTFTYFAWGNETTPKAGPDADAGDFNFGWR